MVAFQPDDLDVVKRGPSLRRRYLDDLAAQLRPQAAADQQEYERALRQRNALLRQEGRSVDRTTLDAWDTRVTESGARWSGFAYRPRNGAKSHCPLFRDQRGVFARWGLLWRTEATRVDSRRPEPPSE